MKPIPTLLACILSTLYLTGCTSAAQHQKNLPQAEEKKMTVGIVQAEIREGMSQADVATALGSPNLVTKDKDGIETWIYDKVSTEYAYSSSTGGISTLILGGGRDVAGGGFGNYSRSSGATASTQRTLTIIIKFKENTVKEYTYHASSF
ncbi:hypothetical protein [Aliamphritea hakodatensis]|uniref:hypothetical protein n=1 Tax=Aliamphritea hakodatensis TaxID=2895352 RepID=UPI0022FD7BFB|nr:hypothetical protein [Aliamphritea hakodatensis]